MKYEIEFTKEMASQKFMEIFNAYERTEHCVKSGDLARNIRNACAFSEAVRSLRVYSTEVDASGIYDDNGYDRIGFARINGHIFVKNGEFNFTELKAALHEIADGTLPG